MNNHSSTTHSNKERPNVNGKIIAEKKREKYRMKLEKKRNEQRKIQERNNWFQTYSQHSTLLDIEDVRALKQKQQQQAPCYRGINSNDDEMSTRENTSQGKRKRPRISEESNNVDDNNDELLTNMLHLIRPYMDLKDSSGSDSFAMDDDEGHHEVSSDQGTTTTTSTKTNNKPKRRQQERYFIAEGTETVRMLMEQSAKLNLTKDWGIGDGNGSVGPAQLLQPIQIHSILTKPSSFFEEPVNLKKTLETLYNISRPYSQIGVQGEYVNMEAGSVIKSPSSPLTAQTSTAAVTTTTNTINNALPFHVLVGAENVLNEIIGYPVARGAIACGKVPTAYDEEWLHKYVRRKLEQMSSTSTSPIRILALDKIDDTANLGSIIRSAAAFGIHVIILSADSCDVWYRRCVRVSMGHALTVPSVRVSDLSSTIINLRKEHNVMSYAAVIDNDEDTMVLERTPKGGIHSNWCCVLGNEGNGISSKVASSCDRRIRIEMTESVDSLSVGVAAGIIMHGLRERETTV